MVVVGVGCEVGSKSEGIESVMLELTTLGGLGFAQWLLTGVGTGSVGPTAANVFAGGEGADVEPPLQPASPIAVAIATMISNLCNLIAPPKIASQPKTLTPVVLDVS